MHGSDISHHVAEYPGDSQVLGIGSTYNGTVSKPYQHCSYTNIICMAVCQCKFNCFPFLWIYLQVLLSPEDSPHHPQHLMLPFQPMRNIDGLSNDYHTHYRCEESPTCSESHTTCNSPYLFCDSLRYRCVAKLQIGSRCDAFSKDEPCYQSQCCSGKPSDCSTVSFYKINFISCKNINFLNYATILNSDIVVNVICSIF